MLTFQESLNLITSSVADEYLTDIDAALDEVERRVKKLPGFLEYQRGLVRSALRHMIDDCRHVNNVETKRQNGFYGKPAKVVVGRSNLIAKVHRKWLDYRIGGTTLGQLKGSQLATLAKGEHERGIGYMFNAMLLTQLQAKVSSAQKVSEVFSEVQLAKLATKVRKEVISQRGVYV